MSKDIDKNRRALINYLFTAENSQGGPPHNCACAKHNILLCLGLEKRIQDFMDAGDYDDYEVTLVEMLGLDKNTWDRIECFYEGWTKKNGIKIPDLDGETKSMRETASYLQTLPGWPTVL